MVFNFGGRTLTRPARSRGLGSGVCLRRFAEGDLLFW